MICVRHPKERRSTSLITWNGDFQSVESASKVSRGPAPEALSPKYCVDISAGSPLSW